MLAIELDEFVRAKVAGHLQARWATDQDTQVEFSNGKKYRLAPDHDGDPREINYHPSLNTIERIGTTGWNYVEERTFFVVFDLDGLNHAAGHADLDDFIDRLKFIDELQITRSKSGKGYHLTLYFDPEDAPRAPTRKHHTENARAALRWLSKQANFAIEDKTDCCGSVAWIYSAEQGPQGFEQVQRSMALMPEDWREVEPPAPQPKTAETPERRPSAFLPKHQALIDWMEKEKRGEWDAKHQRLHTHTYNLLLASQDEKLNIKAGFNTIATGKGCPEDRNCYAYPGDGGAWNVYRHGKGCAEDKRVWWESKSGWTTTIFNRQTKKGYEALPALVDIGSQCELFHDPLRRPFVVAEINGVKETLPLTDNRFTSSLLLSYTADTGMIAKGDDLKNALRQLEAVAILQRKEHPVAIRVAALEGRLYIDLADKERRIVEVANGEWRVVDDCPVRFIRPEGMMKLPMPLRGGRLRDLRRFVTVTKDDMPLLLAFLIGCFHPAGPYALLQVIGEQGAAKSWHLRFIHDLCDPNSAVGGVLHTSERDMLVAAQKRWIVSYDNVDSLGRKVSSWLCMLATGASSVSRKLFTDDAQCILKAKRPCIITSIHEVVTANDLADRTLSIVLPPIPPHKRKSEIAIDHALGKDGIRGKIFGNILNGVAMAHRDHATVTASMPRLADLFTWATAAETALGLRSGRCVEAFNRQAGERASLSLNSAFALKIIELCNTGWIGTVSELAELVEVPRAATGDQLREIAPALREQGFIVNDEKRTKAKRLIELSKEMPTD